MYILRVLLAINTLLVSLCSAVTFDTFTYPPLEMGDYQIQYTIINADVYHSFIGASTYCEAQGLGWTLATLRTYEAQALIETHLLSDETLIGAAQDAIDGFWYWPYGRLSPVLTDRIFYDGDTWSTNFIHGVTFERTSFPPFSRFQNFDPNDWPNVAFISAQNGNDWRYIGSTSGWFDSWVCEYSPCTISADCESATTVSVSGNWPNCTCVCQGFASGSRCQTISAAHDGGIYESKYQVVCAPDAFTYATAQQTCTDLDNDDIEVGWHVGTVPSGHYDLVKPQIHADMWLGGTTSPNAGTEEVYWTEGRLEGKIFSQGASCETFTPNGLVHDGAGMQYCNWESGQPDYGLSQTAIIAAYPDKTWRVVEKAESYRCTLCERNPCTFSLDCDETTTVSVDDNEPYPACTCVAAATTAEETTTEAPNPYFYPPLPMGEFQIQYILVSSDEFKFWDDASADCASRGDGWSLANIFTSEANDLVTSHLSGEAAWIGGMQEGGWNWMSGGRLSNSMMERMFIGPDGVPIPTYYIHAVTFERIEYPAFTGFTTNSAPPGFIQYAGIRSSDTVWMKYTSSDALDSWICEYSPCNISADCEVSTTESVSGNYPNCQCVCKSFATGSRCQTITVEHPSSTDPNKTVYESEYEVVCASDAHSYDYAVYQCLNLGDGWAVGSVPSNQYEMIKPLIHGHMWLGATLATSPESAYWLNLRSSNLTFTFDQDCVDFQPRGNVANGSSVQYCDWDSGNPQYGFGIPAIAAWYPGKKWQVVEQSITNYFRCTLCERNPCMYELDCDVNSTVSVEPGSYPSCTCVTADITDSTNATTNESTTEEITTEDSTTEEATTEPTSEETIAEETTNSETTTEATTVEATPEEITSSETTTEGATTESTNEETTAEETTSSETTTEGTPSEETTGSTEETTTEEATTEPTSEETTAEETTNSETTSEATTNEATPTEETTSSETTTEGTTSEVTTTPPTEETTSSEATTEAATSEETTSSETTTEGATLEETTASTEETTTEATTNEATPTEETTSSETTTEGTTSEVTTTPPTEETTSSEATTEAATSEETTSSVTAITTDEVTTDEATTSETKETTTTSTTTTTKPTTNSTTPTRSPATTTPTRTTRAPVVNIPVTLSTVGFGYKYVQYNTSALLPLRGLHSGLNLLYTQTYQDWTARRYLSTLIGSGQVRLMLSRLESGTVSYATALSKNAKEVDWILINGVAQSKFVDLSNSSILTTGFAPTLACGDLATGGTIVTSNDSQAIQIKVGPSAQQPQCRAAISYAGVAYSSASFYRGAVSAFAYFPSNATFAGASSFLSEWQGSRNDTFTLLADLTDAVVIGNSANTAATPAPARLQRIQLYRPSNVSSSETLRIASQTHNSVACSIADQKSFRAASIPINVSNTLSLRQGANPSSCYMYETVDDLHLACHQSPLCVGFTTILMFTPLPKEMPLCIYFAGSVSAASDVMAFPRMFYSKPQLSTVPVCSTSVEKSGVVAVYVQQTTMATNGVQLRINGKLVTQCGAINTFANRFQGADGRCNQWALCYAGSVPADANVTVSSTIRLDQGGCDNSLGVIFVQTSVDSLQVNATTAAPSRRLNVTGLASRSVKKTETDPIKLFVYQGWVAALDVLQTGYSCEGSSCVNESIVSFSTSSACQRCGGTKGFIDGRAGVSDDCDSLQFCGDFMPLMGSPSTSSLCSNDSTGTPIGSFTGFATVSADVTLLSSKVADGECNGFQATVYASSALQLTPVYPLVSNDGQFVTLHARSLVEGHSSFNSSIPQGSTKLLTLLPLSELHELSYVPSWSAGSIQSTLGPNSSQACVIDHSQELAATCTFYIPVGATHVTVRAAQTDFAAKSMVVQVLLDGETVSATDTCGGAANRFGRQQGQKERCDTFSTCSDRYLYSTDADAASNSAGKIVVTLPPFMKSYSCDYQAAVIADFSRPNVEAVECDAATQYECPGERKCLSKNYVCDGVLDCASGADETKCRQLVTAPGEIFCVAAHQQVTQVAQSLLWCTRLAVANGSSIFWYNGTHCTYIIPDLTSSILADPTSFLCSYTVDDTTMYIYVTDRSSFGLCRSTIHCNGRGDASVGAGGVCECSCYEGYSGAACDSTLKLEFITSIACLLEDVNDTTTVSMSVVAEALRLQSKVVTVTCSSISREYQSTGVYLRVKCTLVSTRLLPSDVATHYRRLLRSTIWPTVNATLIEADQPALFYITGSTSMTQDVTIPCLILEEGQLASCFVNQAHDGLRLSVSSNLSAISATVVITEQNSAKRTFATAASCVMAQTPSIGGCIKSSCEIASLGFANASVELTGVVFADPTLLTSSCSLPDISLSAQISYANLETNTNTTVVNLEEDYSPYLISSVTLFVAGALLAWVGAAICAVLFHLRYASIREHYLGSLDLNQYQMLKAELLVRLRLQKDIQSNGGTGWDKCASVFAIFGAVLAICASFLIIYHQTAYSADSNFSVMYEEYSDSYCDKSATGYMPRRIFAVPPGTSSCERMQTAGESAGVSYATGECEGSDGSYAVAFRLRSSKNGCRNAPEVKYESGMCLPLSQIDPTSTRSVFVKLTCSSDSIIAERIDKLKAVTSVADAFVIGELIAPSSRMVPPTAPNVDASSGSPYYRTMYLDGFALASSTSYLQNVIASQASPVEFDNDFDGKRVVAQTLDCDRFDDAPASCSAMESNFQSAMRDLTASSIPSLAPLVDDVPIGHLFGGFGTSDPVTWTGAGPTAHRYYAVAGGIFDMGAQFPSDTSAPSDDEGYSVSMWLRADSSTLGFAYAVTDAFEDDQAMTILPLERLAMIIDSGSGGHEWYSSSYHVYQSLYVNGPGKTLTFAYASPTYGDRVVQLNFDLIEIGETKVMNGQWHHIAVTFIVENSKIRAQLVVDGESSYTKVGWSACVSDVPEPIHGSPSVNIGGQTGAPVYDSITNRVTSGGLLVVGYFNGGVYGLQAVAEPKLNTDFLATGTQLMRDSNAFPRKGTLGLGATILGIAGVLLIYLVVTSVHEIRTLLSNSSEGEYRQAAERFYDCEKDVMVKSSQIDDQVMLPIRFSTALRWLSMDVHEVCEVMAELSAQTLKTPSMALLSLVLDVRIGQRRSEGFGVAKWNEAIQEDSDVAVAQDEEKELQRLPNNDPFTQIFRHSTSRAGDPSSRYATTPKHAIVYSDNEEDGVPPGAAKDVSIAEIKGDVKGVMEVKNVALPNITGGASSTSASFPPVLAVFAPLIGVFQGMHVWSTSIELPRVYDGYFNNIFAFFSIDFTAAFPSVPTLITPIIQVAVGLTVLAVVVYLLIDDDRRFVTGMTRYIWRRDELEPADAKVTTTVPHELLEALPESNAIASGECSIPTLPPQSAHKLDLFIGIAEAQGDADYQSMTEITVETSNGQQLTVTRNDSPATKGGQLLTADGSILPILGARCAHHPKVVLSAVEQNAIYPCGNRSRCCVMGCGQDLGMMFSCGQRYEDANGDDCVCAYALCQQHHQLSVKDQIVMILLSQLRRLKANGLGWILCTVAVLLADAAYTPFMKTALMIVGCHPYYQCEFPECWSHIDQKFALAAFLAFTVIGFLGVGLPAALFVLLRRRRAMMEDTLLDPEHRKYTDATTGSLKISEWFRFVSSDTSALAGKYRDLDPRWLFFPSLIVILKVVTLIPSIFLEPRSLEQRIGCSVVQAVITLVLFAIKAYFSPIMSLTLRAAELHQLTQLGLQSIDLVVRNDRNSSAVSFVMVAVTIVYVIFCFAVAAATVVWPLIEGKLRMRKVKQLFSKHHLPFSGQTTLYVETNPRKNEEFVPEVVEAKSDVIHLGAVQCEDSPVCPLSLGQLPSPITDDGEKPIKNTLHRPIL